MSLARNLRRTVYVEILLAVIAVYERYLTWRKIAPKENR